MPTIDDIYYSLFKTQYDDREFSNVFWWRVRTVGTALVLADSINGWFLANLVGPLADMLYVAATIQSVETYLWKEPIADYDYTAIVEPGTSAGEGEPGFLSATFRSQRNGPGSRYSYKRFGGIGEGLVSGNDPFNDAAWDAVAAVLNDLIVFPEGTTMAPVQVKHSHTEVIDGVKVRVNDLPPVNTGVNPTINFDLTAVWAYHVGTQNSRK